MSSTMKSVLLSSVVGAVVSQGAVPTSTTDRPVVTSSTMIPSNGGTFPLSTSTLASSLLKPSATSLLSSSSSSSSSSSLPSVTATSPCKYQTLPQRALGVPPQLGVSCPEYNAFTRKYQYGFPISADVYFHNLQVQEQRRFEAQKFELERTQQFYMQQQQVQQQQMEVYFAQVEEAGGRVPEQMRGYFTRQQQAFEQQMLMQSQQLDHFGKAAQYQLKQAQLQQDYAQRMLGQQYQPFFNGNIAYTAFPSAPAAPTQPYNYGYYPFNPTAATTAATTEGTDL